MTDGDGSPAGENGEGRARAGIRGIIESPEQLVMNLAFVVLFCAICWGVLSRYVVPTPATWVEEVSGIAFAFVIFVGAAEVQRRLQHVSVDIVTMQLPQAVQRILAIVVNLFVVIFYFYVAYLGVRHAIGSHSSTTSMLRIPLSVAASGFALGFLMLGLRALQQLAQSLRPSGKGA